MKKLLIKIQVLHCKRILFPHEPFPIAPIYSRLGNPKQSKSNQKNKFQKKLDIFIFFLQNKRILE
jgi:hypothetical protein